MEGELVVYSKGAINKETVHFQMVVQGRSEYITFDIMDIAEYPLILGIL